MGGGRDAVPWLIRRWNGERRDWTAEEDEKLRSAFERFNGDWAKIEEVFTERKITDAINRWRCVLNPYIKDGPWTEKEDEELIYCIHLIGPPISWISVSCGVHGRTAEQCKRRWYDVLESKTDLRYKPQRWYDVPVSKADLEWRPPRFSHWSRDMSNAAAEPAMGLQLPEKLRCPSLEDDAPAAGCADSSTMAQWNET